MTSAITNTPALHRPFWLAGAFTILALLFLGGSVQLQAQCVGFPTSTAQDDCANYPPLVSGANVNNGDIFGICGASAAEELYSNINLNGGTLRICANAQITGNYNGGSIVVTCGATLRFPAGLLLNTNVSIINYGTVEVTGDLTFQNPVNYFHNASPDARLIVSGNVNFAPNNNQRGYLVNEGFVSIGGNLNQFEGGYLCLNEGSVITCSDYNYSLACGAPNNRVLYGMASGVGIIRYSGTATIFGRVTNTSNVQIWQATGSTENIPGCGNWGSATLVPNAPDIPLPGFPPHAACNPQNCFTVLGLPVEMMDYDAWPLGKDVLVQWSTSQEIDNDFFTVERSKDGDRWEFVTDVPGARNSNRPQAYEVIDEEAYTGISYYRLKQTDIEGSSTYFEVKTVRIATEANTWIRIKHGSNGERIYLQSKGDLGEIRIYAVNGQEVSSRLTVSEIGNTAEINISTLPAGMYLIQSDQGAGKFIKMTH